MLVTRHLIASISKAIKNNQKYLVLKKKQIKNFQILDIICNHGFIQGYEIRGDFILLKFKQVYYSSLTTSAGKATSDISIIKRIKNMSSLSAKKWNKLINLSGSTACFLISTNKGIFDSRAKISFGGFPLIKIL